jgi:hypothetical protein
MDAARAASQAQRFDSAFGGADVESNTGRNFSLAVALGHREKEYFSAPLRTDSCYIRLSQLQGRGGPVEVAYWYTSGTLKAALAVIKFDPVTEQRSVKIVGGPNLTERDRELIAWVAEQGLEMLMGLNNKTKKRNGGGATTGTTPGASPGGASGSVGGGADGVMEVPDATGGDIFDGECIDANGFFLALAKGMGDTLNKLAEKIMQKLQDIKSQEGTNPDGTNKAAPFSDTAEFQALSQTLAYMQNAFMTTMNAFGDAIKKGTEAGGALR